MSFFTIFALFAFANAQRTVNVGDLGTITGVPAIDVSGVSIDRFFGIPYAVQPVGNLRWRPSSISTSLPSQPFLASDLVTCPQYSISQGQFIGQEDCLVLNIWAPSDVDSSSNLPVIVFTHGGALAIGNGWSWQAQNFVGNTREDNRVIYVTINYRLGALGFYPRVALRLEDPFGFPSNGGANSLGDIITALRWVNRYISYFGGNPNLVTAVGQSAGGLLNNFLLYTDLIRKEGLVKNLIFQSGSSFRAFQPLGAIEGAAQALVLTQQGIDGFNAATGQNLGISLAELRQLDVFTLLNILYGGPTAPLQFAWRIVNDGFYLPLLRTVNDEIEDVNTILDLNSLRLLWTFVQDDTIFAQELLGTTFIPNQPASLTVPDVTAYLSQYGVSQAETDSLLANFYRLEDYTTVQEWFEDINSDLCFICPTYAINREWERIWFLQSAIVFFQGTNEGDRMIHAGDLAFAYADPNFATIFNVNYDADLAVDYINFLADFATTTSFFSKVKTPNGTPLQDFNRWTREVVTFNKNDQRIEEHFFDGYRNGACIFWDTVDDDVRDDLCNSIPPIDL